MRRMFATAVLVVGLAGPAWAGFDEGRAAYLKEDYATAYAEFRPLAEQGDARAQYRLGIMYNVGFGVPADPEQAAMWLGKAAEQNIPDAQFELGYLYYLGRGVKHSPYQAFRWWRRAAALGSLEAQHMLPDHDGGGRFLRD